MDDKLQHYVGIVSLSVLGGNFVLAKVCWGLTSVRCSELSRCQLLGSSKCICSVVNQSGTSEPSAVQRLSNFRRVHYWRFYCTQPSILNFSHACGYSVPENKAKIV